ncbi:MAG: glycosyltransferase [Sphingobacteriia bacterium]|nr:glycosyltransferase [Sphingobacteriia bacterium]
MKNYLISVIIRTVGRESLEQAINSVITQTYKNIEIIVVEDNGKKCEERCHAFNDERIKYYNTGASLGRVKAGNLALTKATGDYLIFLDDDDEFLPTHLATLIAKVDGENIVYSFAYEVGINKELNLKTKPYILQEYYPQEYLYFFNLFPINTVLFPKKAYDELGGFEENIEMLEDWILWAKYGFKYKFISSDYITAIYTVPFGLKSYFKRHFMIKKYFNQASDLINKLSKNAPISIQKIDFLSRIKRKFKVVYILFKARLDT